MCCSSSGCVSGGGGWGGAGEGQQAGQHVGGVTLGVEGAVDAVHDGLRQLVVEHGEVLGQHHTVRRSVDLPGVGWQLLWRPHHVDGRTRPQHRADGPSHPADRRISPRGRVVITHQSGEFSAGEGEGGLVVAVSFVDVCVAEVGTQPLDHMIRALYSRPVQGRFAMDVLVCGVSEAGAVVLHQLQVGKGEAARVDGACFGR
mmetsp:Transcript_34604/g.99640  ORF Transcript_34604/g.99640 Transcript_34604/m.99640 type:complete len:201 (+) Transcript_34604:741-1343(+)